MDKKTQTPIQPVSPNKVTNWILLFCAGIILFGGGYKLGQTTPVFSNGHEVNWQNDPEFKDLDFNLFFSTWKKLDEKYVDKSKLDKKKMFYGAIKGMVASVDDNYTFFLTPDENKNIKADLAGKLEGIGAELEMKDNHITIIAPLKDSPAEKAGIRPGDIITKVDGTTTKGWTLVQAVAKIRGPKGTHVKITVQRDSKEIEFDITRDTFQTYSLKLSYETDPTCSGNCPKVAYVQLYQFGDTTNDEWDKAVEDIQQQWQQKNIKGMVLDVRNNPGGYLDSAVYIASDFLSEGQLVVKQDSGDAGSHNYYSTRSGRLQGLPLSIIINKNSASAAEIVSGSLKDHGKATLVGEKSFGKGSVQEAIDLDNGAGLHVTVAKWILPNGEWINGKGIEPQVPVVSQLKDDDPYSKDKDNQLTSAIQTVLK